MRVKWQDERIGVIGICQVSIVKLLYIISAPKGLIDQLFNSDPGAIRKTNLAWAAQAFAAAVRADDGGDARLKIEPCLFRELLEA